MKPDAPGHNGPPLTYKDAGVDIDAGDALVEHIKPLARSTNRPGVMGGLGGFGGLFDLKAAGFRDPILVSGTDGVGTKLKVAIEAGVPDTVGIDLVAMCVNDIVVQGAEPLFFLDYYASGRLDVDTGRRVVAGIAEGCRRAGCALVGGETAEMPGMYIEGDYDLAGFSVGAAERDGLLPRGDIAAGDVVLGLESSGAHSNGFSLVRRIVERSGLGYAAAAPFAPASKGAASLGQALLEPTRIYVKPLLSAIRSHRRRQGAGPHHRRRPARQRAALPARRHARATRCAAMAGAARLPLAARGGSRADRRHVADVQLRARHDRRGGAEGCRDGRQGPDGCRRERPRGRGDRARRAGRRSRLRGRSRREPMAKLKVGILISGRGSNMAALIEAAKQDDYPAEIALVVSNVADAPGLAIARKEGVPTAVISHRGQPDRETFDRAVSAELERHGVQLVVLAGFLRIFSPWFPTRWADRLINIHPSLLPCFKGLHVQQQALDAGVRLSGCTVHFVIPDLDAGPIIAQAAVPVLADDTEETLSARILRQEHRLYPLVVRWFAEGRIGLAAGRVAIKGVRPDAALLFSPAP